MERGAILYLLLLGAALSVQASPRWEQPEVNDPPWEIPDSIRTKEYDIKSLADQDDALLNSFNNTGVNRYELEDILEELKHSNSTAALEEIMGTEEHHVRVARAICYSTSAYGGYGGQSFADPCMSGIAEIYLCYGCCYPSGRYVIHSIRVKYRHPHGYSFWAPRHGGSKCPHGRHIYLGARDKIVAVVMLASSYRVQGLAFLVQRPYPYGISLYGLYSEQYYGRTIIIRRNVVSFYGRSGGDLDSLGFFYR